MPDGARISGSPSPEAGTHRLGTAKQVSSFDHIIARTRKDQPPNEGELRGIPPETMAAIDSVIKDYNRRQPRGLQEVE